MQYCLIVYQEGAVLPKIAAKTLALVIGNARCYSESSYQEAIGLYQKFIYVGNTQEMFEKRQIFKEWIGKFGQGKLKAVIGVGPCSQTEQEFRDELLHEAAHKLIKGFLIDGLEQEAWNECGEIEDVLDVKRLLRVGAELRRELEETVLIRNPGKLQMEVEEFIQEHNTCTLATGEDGRVRATPIEYIFEEGDFYLISEGGMKFCGMIQNPQVSLCIYEPYRGMDQLKSVQITGVAELVPMWTKDYLRIMGQKNLEEESLHKIPIDLHLIRIKAQRYEFLNSEYRKEGCDAKQILNFWM